MVSLALRRAVDALTPEELDELRAYLDEIVDDNHLDDGFELTDEEIAMLERRDREMDEHPEMCMSGDELFAYLRAKWL